MRVLVTGGNGKIGRHIVDEMARAGHEVRSLDLALPESRLPGVDYRIGNVTDIGDVWGAMQGFRPEAVVHMAAWINPGIVADHRTYRDNTAGAFNVLTAASDCGVRRVIQGSSAQVYGFERHAPLTVPVTEDHPLRPLNSYALSKVANETAGRYFSTHSDTDVLSFRIMGARLAEDMEAQIAMVRRDPVAARFLLWTRIDARDVAGACRAAIEADQAPPGEYNITGAEVLTEEDTRTVLARHCPDLDVSDAPTGHGSPMNCAKARDAFGFAPQHRVRPT
ncbi:NAD-dependent epimerase/dehydratase family protein [Oceaniglobus trochenteri]|uniref:NAD-dependent epimerase/dehydratase family protein n=1 Tax=Oceaniglobus trochenteri TaxID=2763260 RepID=UPI001CFF8042|nr:NAD(P)-dependent oxidoreductase [Oceaniglobus trochenteri]